MCIYAWDEGSARFIKIQHILFDCPAFNECRKLFYELNSLKELFSVILLEKVFEFLSCVNQILCNITFFVCWFLIVFVVLVFFNWFCHENSLKYWHGIK